MSVAYFTRLNVFRGEINFDPNSDSELEDLDASEVIRFTVTTLTSLTKFKLGKHLKN